MKTASSGLAEDDFEKMALKDEVLRGVYAYGFERATAVQAQAIPHLMTHDADFLIVSPPGTGKTAAVVIPIIHRIMELGVTGAHRCTAVFLVPTRELAVQYSRVVKSLAEYTGLKVHTLIGGVSVRADMQGCATANIMVATPGRFLDVLSRRGFDADWLQFLVLDEADSLLTENTDTLFQICQTLHSKFQAVCTASHFTEKSLSIAKRFTKPIWLDCREPRLLTRVELQTIDINGTSALECLSQVYDTLNAYGSTLVFVKTKMQADWLAEQMRLRDFTAVCFHGDLDQTTRDDLIKEFRNGFANFMIGVGANFRGLDFPFLRNVVLYDLPSTPWEFLSQAGRLRESSLATNCFSFALPEHSTLITQIEQFIGKKLKHFTMDS